jgi:hypothetical protein
MPVAVVLPLESLVEREEQGGERDGKDIPGQIAGGSGADQDVAGALACLVGAANGDGDAPQAGGRNAKIHSLQPLAGRRSMRGMEYEPSATAADERENQMDVRILDQTFGPRAFHGDAEIRRALRERVGSGKESDHKRTGALAKADPAAVGERGVLAGEDKQQGKKHPRNQTNATFGAWHSHCGVVTFRSHAHSAHVHGLGEDPNSDGIEAGGAEGPKSGHGPDAGS